MAKAANPYQVNAYLEKDEFEKFQTIAAIEMRSISNLGRVAVKYFISYMEKEYASQGKRLPWREK